MDVLGFVKEEPEDNEGKTTCNKIFKEEILFAPTCMYELYSYSYVLYMSVVYCD